MSKIRQVEENLWIAPERYGIAPKFRKTQHAINHYPNGSTLLHEPVQPGNKKIPIKYIKKEAEDMGEFFEGASAGGYDQASDRPHELKRPC